MFRTTIDAMSEVEIKQSLDLLLKSFEEALASKIRFVRAKPVLVRSSIYEPGIESTLHLHPISQNAS